MSKKIQRKLSRNKKPNNLLFLFLFLILGVVYLLWYNTNFKPNINPLSISCKRTIPYTMEPEFQRAINLITTSPFTNLNDNSITEFISHNKNCINIQYSSSTEIAYEGLFYPDPESTSQNLHILISETIRGHNDWQTATILVHELTHALQFVKKNELGDKTYDSCVDREVDAFKAEISFILQNQNNIESIPDIVDPLKGQFDRLNFGIHDLLNLEYNTRNACGSIVGIKSSKFDQKPSDHCGDDNWYSLTLDDNIRNFVVQNPAYKRLCGLN